MWRSLLLQIAFLEWKLCFQIIISIGKVEFSFLMEFKVGIEMTQHTFETEKGHSRKVKRIEKRKSRSSTLSVSFKRKMAPFIKLNRRIMRAGRGQREPGAGQRYEIQSYFPPNTCSFHIHPCDALSHCVNTPPTNAPGRSRSWIRY